MAMTTWISPPIPSEKWPAALQNVLDILTECGVITLELMHGWSMSDFDQSPAFEDIQWQTETVTLANLTALLTQRVTLGFCLGHDDLFLTLLDSTEIKLCHEGDIHLQTSDQALSTGLQRRLRATLST